MRSTIKPMPSPRGTNHAGKFLRTVVLDRAELMAFDAANGLGEGGGTADLRAEIEGLLAGKVSAEDIAAVLAAIDAAGPEPVGGRHDDPMRDSGYIAKDRNGKPAGKDAEVDAFAAVKKLLAEKGLSEDDIASAIEIARSGGSGGDRLPRNAARPAMDEARRAALEAKLEGRFGTARVVGESSGRQAADHRMGPGRSAVERLNAKYPDLARIGHA